MANISKEARESRGREKEIQALNRNDESYLEIEQFKEYEFSWCIAFEMAKRNPKLIKDTQRFVAFYKRYKSYIDFIPFSMETFEESDEYYFYRKAKRYFAFTYAYLAQEHWLSPIALYYVTEDEVALKMAEVYVHQFHVIQDKQLNERFTLEDEEGILFESSVNLNNEHFFDGNNTVSNEEIMEAIEEFDIDPSFIESNRRATENFSRPKLSIPALYNKNIDVELNLALPEKELLAYVSYIKEKFDKNRDLVKSPIELLGADLESVGIEEVDTKEVYKRDRRKTMSEKYADLFFIYDCYISGMTADSTIIAINEYWGGERDFATIFQIKTYRRYLKLARDFIENRKYQSLLIGT